MYNRQTVWAAIANLTAAALGCAVPRARAAGAARRVTPGQFRTLLLLVPALIHCGEDRPNSNANGAGPTLLLDVETQATEGTDAGLGTDAEADSTSGPEPVDGALTSDATPEVLDSIVYLDQSVADESSSEVDSGPPPCLCDDGNSCSVDGCDAEGACTHTFLPEGAPCSTPGGSCMTQGKCASNFCINGGPSLFSQTIAGSGNAMVALPDGYAIAGEKDGQVWLLRLDLAGQKVWENTYGGGAVSGKPAATALFVDGKDFMIFGPGYVRQVDQAGTLTSGTSTSFGAFQAVDRTSQGYVFTTGECVAGSDAKGKGTWSSCGPGYQVSSVVKALADGYAILGKVGLTSGLYRTGLNGQKLWMREYAGANLTAMAVLPDGFILGGTKGANRLLVKTDASGYPVWERTYSGAASTITPAFVAALPGNGGFALFGSTYFAAGVAPDVRLLRADNSGAAYWDVEFGSPGQDFASALLPLPNGFALLAHKSGGDWLGRVDAWGNAFCAESGACFAKPLEDCADGNPCTYDHCVPAGSCKHPNVPAGASCGKGETCTAGTCSP